LSGFKDDQDKGELHNGMKSTMQKSIKAPTLFCAIGFCTMEEARSNGAACQPSPRLRLDKKVHEGQSEVVDNMH
jgi:hypothetical protein